MKNVPRIAVLFAAYNGSQWIKEQIESIINQKAVFTDIYISVDLSSDDTYRWCCNYSENQSNITVLSYGERFGGAAANFFRLIRDVDFSEFDYVALADQDDIWLEDKLSWACRIIEEKHVDAYSSNVLAFWPNGREKLIVKSQSQKQYDYLFEAAGPGCTYVMKVQPLLIFKKLIIDNQDKTKRVTLHDWLIYAFFRASEYKWFIDSNYKMLYRQHYNNQVGTNSGIAAALKRIKLVRKGWYKEQVTLIANLVNVETIDVSSRRYLLKNIAKLRRRFRDRVFLLFLILFSW